MRVRVIGRFEELPERVCATIRRIEQSTAGQPGPSLTIALGYSGRDELIDACKALVLALADDGVPGGRHRRGDHARVARRPPLHGGRARSRPDHPHERRAAAERVPALAERPQRAVLHRRLLAGVPRARPAARAAHLPAARPAPRLVGRPPRFRTTRPEHGRLDRQRHPVLALIGLGVYAYTRLTSASSTSAATA